MASSLARKSISNYLWEGTEQALYRWGWAVLSMCKILLGGMGKQWPGGGSLFYFHVQGVHLDGPSVVFTSCASSL